MKKTFLAKIFAVVLTLVMIISIIPMNAFATTYYDLYIGGVHVSDANASNITGSNISGHVSYNPEYNSLWIEDATIYAAYMGGTMTSAINYRGDSKLYVTLVGDNFIYGDPKNEEATSSHRYAISSTKDIRFEGPGSLTINASQGGSFSYAIYSYEDIEVYYDTVVTAICDSTASFAKALRCNQLLAEDSTVLVSPSPTGTPLYAFNEVGIDNGKFVKVTTLYSIYLSFDSGAGSGTMEGKYVGCADEYTLPTCDFIAPVGKQFKAWSVNGKEKAVGDKIYPVEDTTLTAVWEDQHICDIKPVEKVKPTCENGGKEAYFKCDDCGKLYEDANGTTEITNIDSWGNLTKLGHTESDWKFDDDNHWKECTVADCGVKIANSTAAHTDNDNNGKCDICEYDLGTATGPENGPSDEEPDNNPSNETPENETPENEDSEDVKSPQTGDNGIAWLWIVLLCISAMSLVATTVIGKKKLVK
ncbi:MAG: hypothetical protein J6B88_07485 [Clostridia bacterium]|nr:hypothetical protein [Clostridia bacterium]